MLAGKSVDENDDDSDWLHRNLTYVRDMRFVGELQNLSSSEGLHGQESYVKSANYKKKRSRDYFDSKQQRDRERYSLMTNEDRNALLHKNREYKKCIRETKTSSPQNDDVVATTGSAINLTGILIFIHGLII